MFNSPAISAYLFNRASRVHTLAEEVPGHATLTQTERRILRLIAENKMSKEIAAELFISHRTVENHRANQLGWSQSGLWMRIRGFTTRRTGSTQEEAGDRLSFLSCPVFPRGYLSPPRN